MIGIPVGISYWAYPGINRGRSGQQEHTASTTGWEAKGDKPTQTTARDREDRAGKEDRPTQTARDREGKEDRPTQTRERECREDRERERERDTARGRERVGWRGTLVAISIVG
eukprot:COSAG02_NODE_947_length_15716_cov_7.567971_4_plen_113_part_00